MKIHQPLALIHRDRDAKLVRELYQKYRHTRSKENLTAFEAGEAWFMDKHNLCWTEIAKAEERDR